MRIHPRYTQRGAIFVLGGATVLTLLILIFIIVFILEKGLPVLNWDFLSTNPRDMGRAGGIFPTIIGTISLPLLAIIIATPLGIFTSVYLTEYTKETKATRIIRFGTDCLAGVPSIIFGLFGFIFFVITLEFSCNDFAYNYQNVRRGN
jgi:phosphate transport system permease protein